jgi:hypothetical protein
MGFVSNIIRSTEFVGPLTGNAESASFASTASYVIGSIESASFSTTASYAFTASYLSGSITNAINAETASYALTASYLETTATASYALTASYLSGSVKAFPYEGDALITGSLVMSGSFIQTTDYGLLQSGGSMKQTVHVTPGYQTLSWGQPIIEIPITPSIDSALFVEYAIQSQPVGIISNSRCGFMAVNFWAVAGNTAVEFSDNSTADFGDTSDLEFDWIWNQVANTMALVVASTPNKQYKIKLIIRKI